MKPLLVLVLAASAMAVPALADMWDGGHGAKHHMGGGMTQRMDLNGDGKVSAAEAEAVRTVMFLRWDTDGDGVVTEYEMIERIMARIKRRIAKRFEMHDVNGDGRIEQAEFAESSAARFAEMDADGDGSLAGEELPAMHRHRHGDRHGGMRHGMPGN
ncbi:MAG TPA: calcium-binding protein [Thermohalobaculum sp.]|nr:calcium-binding protein [Thermohalobaculum sp.]